MRWIAKTLAVALFVPLAACSSSSSETPETETDTGEAQLTAQEVVETCVADDLVDLTGLLDLIRNIGQEGSTLPQPELDLLRLLVDGNVGWSFDLDSDGNDDVTGTVGFTNADGEATIPFDVTGLLGGETPDLAELLADLPDGTTLNLSFELPNGASLSGDAATNGGNVSVTFQGGEIFEVSGGGTFVTEACSFDFGFDDIGAFDPATSTFPVATLNFDADIDGRTLGGDIALDGTNVATIVARPVGAAAETFLLDLLTGQLVE